MNTHVMGQNESGQNINSDGQVVLDCKTGCGRKTTMDGTKLCDFCWEAQRRQGMWSGYAQEEAECVG
jgi:hypothetical protein